MNAAEPIAAKVAEEEGRAGCLNCGAALQGAYCVQCGQKARLQTTLRGFFADFAAGLLNFDGKFWRTLPMLLWRPGELTRRYVEGQRVRFISPVGLYLFTVFLMFAVLGFTGTIDSMRFNGDLSFVVEDEQRQLARLEEQRRDLQQQGKNLAFVDRQIAAAKKDLENLQRLQSGRVAQVEGLEGAPEWLRGAVQRAVSDPKGTMTRVQEAASTYSWLLIPLSVPALRLLFLFRRRQLYAHTVFVTYSLSFMMLLVIAGGLLALAGASAAIPWLTLLPAIHMYQQLKGAYGLSRFGALVRTMLLLIAAFFILILWVLAIIAIGALT